VKEDYPCQLMAYIFFLLSLMTLRFYFLCVAAATLFPLLPLAEDLGERLPAGVPLTFECLPLHQNQVFLGRLAKKTAVKLQHLSQAFFF